MLGLLMIYTIVFINSCHQLLRLDNKTLQTVGDREQLVLLCWSNGGHDSCNIGFETSVTAAVATATLAVIIIPLLCVDMVKQQWVQIIMCGLRWIGVIVVSSLVLWSIIITFNLNPDSEVTIQIGANMWFTSADVSYDDDNIFTVDIILSIMLVMTMITYSQMIQHSVPGILHSMKHDDKLKRVFGGGLTATGAMCIVYGIISTFTPTWNPQSDWNPSTGLVLLLKARYYSTIVLSLIIVGSGFPLTAITLGDNIFYGLPAKMNNYARNTKLKLSIRIGASLVPIIGSPFIFAMPPFLGFDFLWILALITGISCSLVAFALPGILQYRCTKFCCLIWGPVKTPYSTRLFSNPLFSMTVAVLIPLLEILTIGLYFFLNFL